MKTVEMFDRLVENALDFLVTAVSALQKEPKYSVIHFHAALELFLKARLMHDHWSLVVTKKQEADWDKFVTGDFQSVSLDEAANRLQKIVRSGLSHADIEAFRGVARHRNKMVHFFHEAQSEEESKKLTRSIVKQQLKAWYFLHQLLSVQWKEVFLNWAEKIAEVDAILRKSHEFLQVIFDSLEADLNLIQSKGGLLQECPSCGFMAQQHEAVEKNLYQSKCWVCGLIETCLKIECPECNEIVTFRNEGFATCQSCDKSIEPKDVADALIDSASAHIAAKEGDDTWGLGNCSDCDGYHTVVRTESDEWICASCFGEFESLESCEWCNEPNTGDMKHSHTNGCNYCDGWVGWHKND